LCRRLARESWKAPDVRQLTSASRRSLSSALIAFSPVMAPGLCSASWHPLQWSRRSRAAADRDGFKTEPGGGNLNCDPPRALSLASKYPVGSTIKPKLIRPTSGPEEDVSERQLPSGPASATNGPAAVGSRLRGPVSDVAIVPTTSEL